MRLSSEAPPNVYMLAKLKREGEDVTPWPVKGLRSGRNILFLLDVPAPGTYELVLYASPKTLSGTYDSVLRYTVEATAGGK